ncbi:MAG: cupin domain-containing protein [Rhodomicrobium sp.]|nr:cupin domain-containing protein [Rhodomicrobium sp.]
MMQDDGAPLPAKSTHHGDYQHTPQPVAAMAVDYPDGYSSTPHSHPRAQLLFAMAGVMKVTTDDGTWIVPPSRAVWIPPGKVHRVQSVAALRIRTAYIEADLAQVVGPTPARLAMSAGRAARQALRRSFAPGPDSHSR